MDPVALVSVQVPFAVPLFSGPQDTRLPARPPARPPAVPLSLIKLLTALRSDGNGHFTRRAVILKLDIFKEICVLETIEFPNRQKHTSQDSALIEPLID